jgi:hypothetical protein
MASLTGQKIKDTYQSLLKTADNGLVTNAFKGITDGSGSASGLYLKNDGVSVSGSLQINGNITGSVAVSGSVSINNSITTQMFMHPQTITEDITIPNNYNAFLLSPVGINNTITVGSGSNLSIL